MRCRMVCTSSLNPPKRIPLAAELKIHEFFLPCLNDTNGATPRNTAPCTARGNTARVPVDEHAMMTSLAGLDYSLESLGGIFIHSYTHSLAALMASFACFSLMPLR